MDYQLLQSCLCCDSEIQRPVINLGEQVPANAVHDGMQEQTRYPLRVVHCPTCSHLQLDRSVDPGILYRDYPYATGVSASMAAHLKQLANWIGPCDVLEIGCNDGTLMKALRERSAKVVGVDPATTWNEKHKANGFTVLNEYWSEDVASDLGQSFDVVVGTNVFAHLRDPKAALRACAKVLRPDGMVVFEVHRAEAVLRGQFDTIYHEHLSYFTEESAAALAVDTGLHLTQVLSMNVHGGSYRLIYSMNPKGFQPAPVDMSALDGYGERLEMRRKALLAVLHPGVVCVGASARATVMMQAWQPPVVGSLDDAPMKVWKFVAGTKVPIIPFGAWEGGRAQLILGAWNLYESMLPRLADLYPGAELVSYQPELKVERL